MKNNSYKPLESLESRTLLAGASTSTEISKHIFDTSIKTSTAILHSIAKGVAQAQPSVGSNEVNFCFITAEAVSESIEGNMVGPDTPWTINNLFPIASAMTKVWAEKEALASHPVVVSATSLFKRVKTPIMGDDDWLATDGNAATDAADQFAEGITEAGEKLAEGVANAAEKRADGVAKKTGIGAFKVAKGVFKKQADPQQTVSNGQPAISKSEPMSLFNNVRIFSALAITAGHAIELKSIVANVLNEYRTKGTIKVKPAPTIAFTTQLLAEIEALYHTTMSVPFHPLSMLPHLSAAQGYKAVAKLASDWNKPEYASKTTGAFAVEALLNSHFIINQAAHLASFLLTSKALLKGQQWNAKQLAIVAPIKAMAAGITTGVIASNLVAPLAQSLFSKWGAPYTTPVYQTIHSNADAASKWTDAHVGQPLQKLLYLA